MMEQTTFSDDIRRYLGLVWHWAWLLVLVTAVAGGGAYLYYVRQAPIYQATSTVLVNEAPANKATDYAAVMTSERLAQTYAQMMTTEPVLAGVIESLGISGTFSPAELKKTISVQPMRDTQLIEVKAESTDPALAAAVANFLVAEFSKQILDLQTSRFETSMDSLEVQRDETKASIEQISQELAALEDTPENKAERTQKEAFLAQYRTTYAYLVQSYEQVRMTATQATTSVATIEPAVPPSLPIRPRPLSSALLASVIGLLLAGGIVFLVEALDDTLSPDDITRRMGLPVLGVVSRHDVSDRPVTISQPRAPVAEAFRSLRTNIQFASVDRPLRTLLVTSPSPQDGKSTVAGNLAVTLAQSGREVVLIEADLRRPRVHHTLNLPNRNGLTSLFVKPHLVLNGSLQPTSIPGLTAITSGDLPPNPAELLGSEKMYDILSVILQEKDLLVIDSPPVMAVTDAAVLAPRMDGVLLVVRPGTTKYFAFKQAVEQLQRVGANLLGVVLNDVEVNRASYKYAYYKGYYYSYHKYYGTDKAPKPAKQ